MQAHPHNKIDVTLRGPHASGLMVHPVDGRRSILIWVEGGDVRAYCNLCRHLPIPLDAGTGRLKQLVCSTHGATYDPRSGLCTRGPCAGQALHPLQVERRADGLRVTGVWPD